MGVKIAFVVLMSFMNAHYEQYSKINHIIMANRTVYLTGSWKTLIHSKAAICEKTCWIYRLISVNRGKNYCRDMKDSLFIFVFRMMLLFYKILRTCIKTTWSILKRDSRGYIPCRISHSQRNFGQPGD